MKNYGQTSEDNQDSGILSNPISFLLNGEYVWHYAGINGRGNGGNSWSLRSTNTISSFVLGLGPAYLNPQSYNFHGFGYAVRRFSVSPNPSPLSLILAIL